MRSSRCATEMQQFLFECSPHLGDYERIAGIRVETAGLTVPKGLAFSSK